MFNNLKGYEVNVSYYGHYSFHHKNTKVGFETLKEAESFLMKKIEEMEKFWASYDSSVVSKKLSGLLGIGFYIPKEREPSQICSVWVSYCGNSVSCRRVEL